MSLRPRTVRRLTILLVACVLLVGTIVALYVHNETKKAARLAESREAGMAAYKSGDYQATLDELGARGHEVLLGGTYNGVTFAYLSTDRDLGVVTEIFDGSPGEGQAPDRTYP